jgi:prepilin-type N-terminal cleavage/methylation domain-containing protein
MKTFISRNRSFGFTLVETMLVVALISMLSAIAVPNFLRARQRAQATRILDDLRMVDGALDLYAIDNSKSAGDAASWSDLQPYLKQGSVLYGSNGNDLLGNPFNDGTFSVDSTPKISSATFATLSDVAPSEFWSPYAP